MGGNHGDLSHQEDTWRPTEHRWRPGPKGQLGVLLGCWRPQPGSGFLLGGHGSALEPTPGPLGTLRVRGRRLRSSPQHPRLPRIAPNQVFCSPGVFNAQFCRAWGLHPSSRTTCVCRVAPGLGLLAPGLGWRDHCPSCLENVTGGGREGSWEGSARLAKAGGGSEWVDRGMDLAPDWTKNKQPAEVLEEQDGEGPRSCVDTAASNETAALGPGQTPSFSHGSR